MPAPPPVLILDKRSLPPNIRQEIVDLHAQYPAFHPHEIATICFVKFNRKPAPATVKLILASGREPPTTERDGEDVVVPFAEVQSGDLVLIRSGDRIPVDGVVLPGSASAPAWG